MNIKRTRQFRAAVLGRHLSTCFTPLPSIAISGLASVTQAPRRRAGRGFQTVQLALDLHCGRYPLVMSHLHWAIQSVYTTVSGQGIQGGTPTTETRAQPMTHVWAGWTLQTQQVQVLLAPVCTKGARSEAIPLCSHIQAAVRHLSILKPTLLRVYNRSVMAEAEAAGTSRAKRREQRVRLGKVPARLFSLAPRA